jgi:predicted MFS family arabinose efflux permease
VVYAFNWYNVGAVLPLIGISLHANAAETAIVLGAFLVGVGIFQVPAGVLDLHLGSRQTALMGLVIMGAAGVASAFSLRILDLVVLRFVAGAGAAFFFSPALSLISSYFPPGQRGPVIGLFNGGFSIGGAIGVTAGAAIGLRFGWGYALGLGGAGLLILVLYNWIVLPREPFSRAPRNRTQLLAAVLRVLRSRSIWALSLAFSGFWGAVYLVAQDFVEYAYKAHFAWGTQTAANIATVFIVMSFPGGPLGGWLAEQGWDRRWVLVIFAAGDGILIAIIPFLGLYVSAGVFVFLGLFDGIVFAVLYLIPSYLPESQGESLALGIAVINSIQVLLGSAIVVAFGFIAETVGFTTAWIFAGALTLGGLPLVLFVSPNRAGTPRVPDPIPSATGAGALSSK